MHAATLFFLLLMQLTLPVAGRKGTVPTEGESPKLEVTLSVDKATFVVNETIPVHVQVSNIGVEPILIGNDVYLGGGVGNLEMSLRDATGRISPQTKLTHDYFPSPVAKTASTVLLRFWMLLRPGTSLKTTIQIDGEFFSFLQKPGYYLLSADYYSSGFSSPTFYRARGLSDEEVRSIPFTSWSGKIPTNTLKFKIISRRAPKP